MTSRYSNREIRTNFNRKYIEFFRTRNVNLISQYTTPNDKPITSEDVLGLTRLSHIWSLGDRFYKLAAEHYGDPALWWVIAWYNRMPTEAHVKIGWVVTIPHPIEDVLQLWSE